MANIKNKSLNAYRPEYPLEVALVVTTRCNSKCMHCSAHQPQIGICDMPLSLTNRLLKNFKKQEVFTVNLTGGEPFLYKGIWSILNFLENTNIGVHLNSNFTTLTEKEIEYLAAFHNINHIDVTLHCGRGGFEEFTGLPASFYSKQLLNVKYALRLGMDVAIATTINSFNSRYLEELVHDVSSLEAKVPLVITTTHPTGRALANWHKLRFANNEVRILKGRLMGLSRRYNQEIIFQTQFPDKNYTEKYYKNAKKQNLTGCPCGEFSCFIWPTGDVTWCPYSTADFFVMGNVNDERLDVIWNNKTVNERKQYRLNNIDYTCKACRAIEFCKGGCPVDAYNVTGSVLSKDPFCPAGL